MKIRVCTWGKVFGIVLFVMLSFFMTKATFAQAPSTIKGHVYDMTTSTVISGVTVTVNSYSDDTDDEGYYSITGFFTGTYTVSYSHSDYTDTSISYSFSPGVTYTVDMYLTRTAPYPGSLSGTVSDVVGFVEGVTVSIDGNEATTNSNGDYSFDELDAGTYDVEFTKIGYIDLTVTDVEIVANDATDLDVTMERTSSIISGVVTSDSSGEALEGVVVTINETDYSTNINGEYSIELEWGTYNLEFTMDGYADVNLVVDAGDAENVNLDVVMPLGRRNIVAGDANGDCLLVGGDVTYLVNYFRGLQPAPTVVDCPE